MAAVIRWAFIIVLGTLVGIGALGVAAYVLVLFTGDPIPSHLHMAYFASAAVGIFLIHLLLKARI